MREYYPFPSEMHTMRIPDMVKNALAGAWEHPMRAAALVASYKLFPWERFDEAGYRVVRALGELERAITERRYSELEDLRKRVVEAWLAVIGLRLTELARSVTADDPKAFAEAVAELEAMFAEAGWTPASVDEIRELVEREGKEGYFIWRSLPALL